MSVLELSQREEDDRKFKDLASFKAQFPTILASKPFVPAKSKRLLTGNLTAERERERERDRYWLYSCGSQKLD